jgi:site-specific DNA recombinase
MVLQDHSASRPPKSKTWVGEMVRKRLNRRGAARDSISELIERVVLSERVIRVTLRSENDAVGAPPAVIEIEQNQTKSNHSCSLPADTQRKPDEKLLQAVVRAHAWLADLQSGRFSTIEELATAAKIHPKVARQGLRLAFLAPK